MSGRVASRIDRTGVEGEETATVRTSRALKRRRIIERTRLFALLDESPARVRMLVAPAGYGKTTLAEQWVSRDDRQGTWFTARRSSVDVAALALGVARATAELVPGCDERLREHLRAVPNPGGHVEVLAEILGEELLGWPDDAWLVLDEYQELVAAPEAERFVSELLAACPIRLLIASRQRPTWANARSILYGEVLELNQTVLAMDSREAAEVLAGRTTRSAAGLVALANGWPAVIALASVSSAEIDRENEIPESLYRFFAEEVFDALGEQVRSGLATLAVAPILDRELAGELLGKEAADLVCAAALEVGILEERGNQLELHPLARSFLDESPGYALDAAKTETLTTCLRYYGSRRDWDTAFDVIARRGTAKELELLFCDAVGELLDTARLPTIETWCDVAVDWGVNEPVVAIARAEVALRQGRHTEAQAFAEVAASAEPWSSFRALCVAGRAAHLASREEEGLELYRRAESVARTEADRRDALWGRVLCAIELERPEIAATLDRLCADVRIGDPRDLVRAAAYKLMFQLRLARLDLTDADRASEVLPAVSDPLIESAFQSVYASALALAARYSDALSVATTLLSTAERYRYDFAVPYAHISAAMAHAGLREFKQAVTHLDRASASAGSARDAYADQLAFAVRLRSLAQEGRHDVALALAVPELGTALPAIRAEVIGSRALVLASAGRISESLELVDAVRDTSRAVEWSVLFPAVRAIAALKRRDRDLKARVAELEETAFRTGATDLLVTTYRANPEVLQVLVRTPRHRERVIELIQRAHDDDLVRAIGHRVMAGDPIERLSAREREVYDLLCQGLSNRQIAEILYISESTVKVHAHHVYDKLGTRSRTALALQAALRRTSQATSATDESESDATS